MATTIKGKEMTIDFPSSEAIIPLQLLNIKERTVGSYYLSAKLDQATLFLNHFHGSFFIDLSLSYLLCNEAFQVLLEHCCGLYRGHLDCTREALDNIRWASQNCPSTLIKMIENPMPTGASGKYLKIGDTSQVSKMFKSLCIGDITEIVIAQMPNNVFVIYVKPKKDAVGSFDDPEHLLNWIHLHSKSTKL